MWNQGMSWEKSTFSHPTCISNKARCTNCGPVKGRCSEVLEYLTTRCHIYGCVCHHCSHPAGYECWQQGKWGVWQELHDVSNRFHQHVNFPKRGTNTLDYDYIRCVSVCTLTSAENTASQVPSLLDTLNTFCGRFDNTALTMPGEKERMSLSALPRLLLRLQRHHSTDANRKTIHSGAQYFSGELGPGLPTRQVSDSYYPLRMWTFVCLTNRFEIHSWFKQFSIQTILDSKIDEAYFAKNKANNGIERE